MPAEPHRPRPDAGTGIGVDLLHESHRVAAWLAEFDGPLVAGQLRLRRRRPARAGDGRRRRPHPAPAGAAAPTSTLAFLATPTDVFAVPAEAVAEASRRWDAHEGIGRVRRPLRMVSGGRLLARNYPPDADPGINDSLVAQQGPNYALAKRLQRWRATATRADGRPVSLRVAPATRTRSVVKNRLLAAAFAGAHRFGIEVFEPATSNTLMAALLVHDLCAGRPADGRTRGRTRRSPPPTAGCGASRTRRAACSASPSSSAPARPADRRM